MERDTCIVFKEYSLNILYKILQGNESHPPRGATKIIPALDAQQYRMTYKVYKTPTTAPKKHHHNIGITNNLIRKIRQNP